MNSQLTEADSRKPRIDYAIVRARLEAGEFNADLAREYGVKPCAISNGARRAGWKRNGQHTKMFGREIKLTLEQRRVIADRVRAGEMQTALAAEYGVSRTRIFWIAYVSEYRSPASYSSRPGSGASETGISVLGSASLNSHVVS